MTNIGANTAVVGLAGFPARHSLSPAMHNAAYVDMGLDAVFVAFEVGPERLAAAVDGVRGLGLKGLAVTIPHKQSVIELIDHLAPSATAAGAVNWVQNNGGELTGHNTDGTGFLRSLADAGVDVSDRTITVVGAGGSARSIALTLLGAGADVQVSARRLEAARALVESIGGRAVPPTAIFDADIVVNCTPVGMAGGPAPEGLSMAIEGLGAHHIVVDIVYAPERTPLLAAAAAVGATTVGGLGMLAHQAAEQIRLWSGRQPPVATMLAAARHQPRRHQH